MTLEASTIRAKLAGDMDRQAIDAYLHGKARVPPFADNGYSAVLRASYPLDVEQFVARDITGNITGALSTYVRRGASTGRELHSPPYGLTADDDASASALVMALVNYCHGNGVVRTTINCGMSGFDLACRHWRKTTILKKLDGSVDDIWNGFRAKTRNMIRKSEKNGVVMAQGEQYLSRFYPIYAERMAQLGLSVHSRTYFENLFLQLGENIKLFVALQGDEVLGGMIFLFGSGVAFYHYNASQPKGRSLGINDYLMWEIIKDCKERNIEVIDLGEATPDSPVYKFKTREMGGTPHDTFYYDVLCDEGEQPKSGSRPLFFKVCIRLLPYFPEILRVRFLRAKKSYDRLV